MATIPPQRDESDLLRHTFHLNNGQTLYILSDPINSWGYATGNTLWTSSEELIQFFGDNYPADHFQGKRVLELGAGLGAVGMSLAKRGARVVLTDKPEVLELTQRNVRENFSDEEAADRVQVCCLKWGTPTEELPPACRGPFDVVIGSDIVYGHRSNYFALLATLASVTDEKTDIIFALPDRKESKLLARDLLKRQFHSKRLTTIIKPHFENPVVIYRLFYHSQTGRIPKHLPVVGSVMDAIADGVNVTMEDQPSLFEHRPRDLEHHPRHAATAHPRHVHHHHHLAGHPTRLRRYMGMHHTSPQRFGAGSAMQDAYSPVDADDDWKATAGAAERQGSPDWLWPGTQRGLISPLRGMMEPHDGSGGWSPSPPTFGQASDLGIVPQAQAQRT